MVGDHTGEIRTCVQQLLQRKFDGRAETGLLKPYSTLMTQPGSPTHQATPARA
jgi:hypothetical protein